MSSGSVNTSMNLGAIPPTCPQMTLTFPAPSFLAILNSRPINTLLSGYLLSHVPYGSSNESKTQCILFCPPSCVPSSELDTNPNALQSWAPALILPLPHFCVQALQLPLPKCVLSIPSPMATAGFMSPEFLPWTTSLSAFCLGPAPTMDSWLPSQALEPGLSLVPDIQQWLCLSSLFRGLPKVLMSGDHSAHL